MRLIEIVADAGYSDTLAGIAAQHEVEDIWWGGEADDGRRSCRMLVSDSRRQPVMDTLQHLLGSAEGARILVLPVDVALPRVEEETKEASRVAATREELYSQIEKGARLDSTFVLLTMLSTVVAAIGLLEDNVAVVVGAMVIAPLLGPNIALAFATSLGDAQLAWAGFRAELAGLGMALLLSVLVGLLWPVDISSHEILARTDVGLDGVALALASGAAAVLSLTTGLSSTLVGVMVAVALLPPTATLGMLLGAGHGQLAMGAALLLAVNLVCVILAAKLVFLIRGIKPRTWLERDRARQSVRAAVVFWMMLWALLLLVIYLRGHLAG